MKVEKEILLKNGAEGAQEIVSMVEAWMSGASLHVRRIDGVKTVKARVVAVVEIEGKEYEVNCATEVVEG